MLRRYVPRSLKLRLKLGLRAWADFRSGTLGQFARPGAVDADGAPVFSLDLSQPILNATTEQSRLNKIHNIRQAAASIEALVIRPGDVFSFWRAVGEPSKRNQFMPGITLMGGKVVEDHGGGLCQLSGIVYHLSLIAGLTVLERANHSVDLYHDRDRYTPLGADCTVFYGYKDLRLRNELGVPVRFRFEVEDQRLTCILEAPEALPARDLAFETVLDTDTHCEVLTRVDGTVIATSRYEKEQRQTTAEIHGFPTDRAMMVNPDVDLRFSIGAG